MRRAIVGLAVSTVAACLVAAAIVVADLPNGARVAVVVLLLLGVALRAFFSGRTLGARALPWVARDASRLASSQPPDEWPFTPWGPEAGARRALVNAAEELARAGRDGVLVAERALFDGRQDALQRLAAGLAGRLAEILAGARTVLATLDRGVREPAPREPGDAIETSLAQLHRSIERATRMVEGLRALSPAGAPEPLPVPLRESVARAVDERRARATRQGIDLALDAPDEAPVAAEPGTLVAAVGPLLDNALDALDGRGGHVRVTVAAAADRGAWIVTVEDDGPGLAPAQLDRAFDPLFTTRDGGDGLGLGLPFARAAAARCGGTLTLESPEGHGVRAVLRFPVARVAART